MNASIAKMIVVFGTLGVRIESWSDLSPEEKATTERQFVQTLIKLFQVGAKNQLDDLDVIQEGLLVATGQLTECICESSPMTQEDEDVLIDYLMRNNQNVTKEIAMRCLDGLIEVSSFAGICSALVGKTSVAVVQKLVAVE